MLLKGFFCETPQLTLLYSTVIELLRFTSTGMAIAEILVLCGFFMIYIVEEVTHKVIDRMHHGPKVADVGFS